jgi:hypothetical protein
MNPQHPPTSPADSQPVAPKVLRARYESGATVDELVAASGLSYGTVLNRLHDAGTVMRTSWQTRRLRQDPQARQRLAARLRTLYEDTARPSPNSPQLQERRGSLPEACSSRLRHRAHDAADAADARRGAPR